MRQFKIERRDPRIEMCLPVQLTATDVSGAPFDQEVITVNVSRQGALLKGIRGKLRVGSQVSLARLQKQEQFSIAWVGKENTPGAGQIGVSAIAAKSSFGTMCSKRSLRPNRAARRKSGRRLRRSRRHGRTELRDFGKNESVSLLGAAIQDSAIQASAIRDWQSKIQP